MQLGFFMSFNRLYLFVLIIVLFLSVSMVSAEDLNETNIDNLEESNDYNISDIEKTNSKITFDINSTYEYNQTVNVGIFLNDVENNPISGIVNLKLNDSEYKVNVNNGVGNYSFYNLTPQKYNLTFTYSGDNRFNASSNQTTFTLNKYKSELIIGEVKDIKTNDNINLNVTLNSDTSGIAYLYINDKFKQNIYLNVGYNLFNLSSFVEGQYNITIIFPEDSIHESANSSVSFHVSKVNASFKIYCQNISAGDDEIITIDVIPENFNSEVIISINDINNTVLLKNKINNITISNLTNGTYNISVIFQGNNRFNNFTSTSSFTVSPSLSNLSVSIVKNNLTGNIQVNTNSEKCTGIINLYINQKNYTSILNNGSVNFNVDFDVGTNYIYVFYNGDKFFMPSNWTTSIGEAQNPYFITENIISYEYNNFTYTVILCEENGMGMPNRNITIELLNQKINITTNNQGIAYFTTNLKSGNYTINAHYENISTQNNITVENIEFDVNTKDILYLDDEFIEVYFKRNISGNIFFKLSNDVTNKVNINRKSVYWNLTNLNAGDYEVEVYYENELYKSDSVIKTFNVNKTDVNFDMNISNMNLGETGLISLVFSNNITGNITLTVDENTYLKNITIDKIDFYFDDLSKGYHNLSIIYSGDNNFNNYSFNSSFSVRYLKTDINLEVNDTFYGDEIRIIANLENQTKGNVSFYINSIKYDAPITNGSAILVCNGINVGNHTVIAKYGGDDLFLNSSNQTTFAIEKSNSTINLYVGDVYLDENIRIYADLSPNSTGYVTYSMLNYYTPRNKTIINSTSSWYISPLETGQYEIYAYYSGDDNYYPSNTSFILNITQQRSVLKVNIADVNNKEWVIVRARLTSQQGIGISGIVNLTINSKVYTLNVRKGSCSLILGTFPIDNYKFTAIYEGDENHTSSYDEGSFKVTDYLLNVSLTANNLVKHYGGSEKLIISLSTSNGQYINNANIHVKIENKEYNLITDDEGIASMNITLKTGIYNASISFNQTGRYFASKINVQIEILPTIQSINLTKLYGDNEPYYALFMDCDGNPLSGVPVTFIVQNKSYTFNTAPNGVSRVNINFAPGTYTIFAKNPLTGENVTNTIHIFTYIEQNKDIVCYYGAGSIYKVKILDNNAKPAVNVNVEFKINGKTYKVKTDKKGYASYKINLKPKSYVISVKYENYTVFNRIIVKPVLYAQNVIVKKGNAFKFKAKLVNSKGKAVKGKKLIFKIKGKKYAAKTNKKGYATVIVKLKLKVGKHKIKTKYSLSSITNFVKVTK